MSDSLLDGMDGWDIQLGIWGYAVQGEVIEISALVAEGKAEHTTLQPWDSRAADLRGQMVSRDGGPFHPVALRAALPWVTEHMLRGHVDWSPL